MSNYNWKIKHFSKLNLYEFHDLVQLREKVFVVEQDCPYLDVDGKDIDAYHVWCEDDNGKPLCTSRILKPNVSYKEASIGRVCVAMEARKQNIGRIMMEKSIFFIKNEMLQNEIRLSAQTYLTDFYTSLGFKAVGDVYLEDDIPHIEMYYQ